MKAQTTTSTLGVEDRKKLKALGLPGAPESHIATSKVSASFTPTSTLGSQLRTSGNGGLGSLTATERDREILNDLLQLTAEQPGERPLEAGDT